MSSRPSYAAATSQGLPKPSCLPLAIIPSVETNETVRKWLDTTASLARLDSARHPPARRAHHRRDSEPVIQIVRKGRIYYSRPTPPGSMNSRDRRKLRRALERAATAVDECAAVMEATHLYESEDDLPPYVPGQDTSSTAFKDYKFPAVPAPTPASDTQSRTSPVLGQALPPSNPFLRLRSSPPSPPGLSRQLCRHDSPPPSSSEDTRSFSPDSTPQSLACGRRASLNVHANEFTPSLPCRLKSHAAVSSISSHSDMEALQPISDEDRTPTGDTARSTVAHHQKSHSIALAAWEAMQRQLAERYGTMDSSSTHAGLQVPLSHQTTPRALQFSSAFGPVPLPVPHPAPPAYGSTTRMRSGSLLSASTHTRTVSSSSFGYSDASCSTSDFHATRRRSSLSLVYAACGEDPDVDHLADLAFLTLASEAISEVDVGSTRLPTSGGGRKDRLYGGWLNPTWNVNVACP